MSDALVNGWSIHPQHAGEVMQHMSDDDLLINLEHKWSSIRQAAEAEAASRWAETIMPKDER